MKALLASLDWRSAGQGIRSYRGQGIGPPLIIVMLLAMVLARAALRERRLLFFPRSRAQHRSPWVL